MTDRQRYFVRQMITEAYAAYVAYAGMRIRHVYADSGKGWMGKDVLRNLITSMGTLWITGHMAEFEKAEAFLKQKLDFRRLDDENIICYFITDYLGGLLELYALTRREWYKDKALVLARYLKKAYHPTTGLPYWKMNMKTGKLNGMIIAMSDAYNGALEYTYLSAITGNSEFKNRMKAMRADLKGKLKPDGVFVRRLNVETGEFWGTQAQLSRDVKDLYFTLLKEVILSKGEDREAMELYYETITNLSKPKSQVFITSRTGQIFLQGYDPTTKKDEKMMEYDSCYAGGMMALGAVTAQKLDLGLAEEAGENYHTFWEMQDKLAWHMELAYNITATGMRAHNATTTKLAPRKFIYNDSMDGTNNYWGPYDKQYHLSHEMAETYFIMWRLTKENQYREAAWSLAEAIKQHCKASHQQGYSSIKRVDQVPTEKISLQPTHFISATLKFLFLTFCDDTAFPLDQWVFNSAGHLFPVIGSAAFDDPTAGGAMVFRPTARGRGDDDDDD